MSVAIKFINSELGIDKTVTTKTRLQSNDITKNKRVKKTIIYIAIAIATSVETTNAQDSLILDITMCRKMALKNSEEIKIADQTLEKVKGEKQAAQSAWFPNIMASATGMYTEKNINEELYLPTMIPNPETENLVPNVAVNPLTGQPITDPDGNTVFNQYAYMPINLTLQGGVIASISAEQPIYAGGKIIAGNKMAEIANEMAEKNILLKKNNLIYHTDQAYYTYISVKAKVELAKKYASTLSELATTAKNSFETGMSNKNDLLKITVAYNQALLQLQQAQTGLTLAQMSLCRIIGTDFNTKIHTNDSIILSTVNNETTHNSIAKNRVEYILLEQQTKMAEQKIKMIRGNYMPTAGISAGYNYSTILLENNDNYNSQGFMAMGSIKIPITTFGERKGKITATKAEHKIKELELQQAEKLLQLEIEQAMLYYIDAQTRVEMTKEALIQATENMRISEDNYELGMETTANLLEAKTQWQKAYSDNIDALADFKIKETNLLRVTNTLTN